MSFSLYTIAICFQQSIESCETDEHFKSQPGMSCNVRVYAYIHVDIHVGMIHDIFYIICVITTQDNKV